MVSLVLNKRHIGNLDYVLLAHGLELVILEHAISRAVNSSYNGNEFLVSSVGALILNERVQLWMADVALTLTVDHVEGSLAVPVWTEAESFLEHFNFDVASDLPLEVFMHRFFNRWM